MQMFAFMALFPLFPLLMCLQPPSPLLPRPYLYWKEKLPYLGAILTMGLLFICILLSYFLLFMVTLFVIVQLLITLMFPFLFF